MSKIERVDCLIIGVCTTLRIFSSYAIFPLCPRVGERQPLYRFN